MGEDDDLDYVYENDEDELAADQRAEQERAELLDSLKLTPAKRRAFDKLLTRSAHVPGAECAAAADRQHSFMKNRNGLVRKDRTTKVCADCGQSNYHDLMRLAKPEQVVGDAVELQHQHQDK